jgi:GxxExxY protein
MSEEFLYKELSYHVRKCIFEVQNEIGVGFDEETYHQGLIRKFKQQGIAFDSKARQKLTHRQILIHELVLDFLIENCIILSLKCLACDFLPMNYIQLFNELKLWEKHVGFIANFGFPKVKIARRIFHEKLLEIEENYEFIKGLMNESEREILKKLRQSILFVGRLHGLGYGKNIVQRLIEVELTYNKVTIEKNFGIHVYYFGEMIRTYKMRHLLVEKNVVCHVTALKDTITHCDISTVKSYLHALKLNIGLVVNFGKSKLQICGVRGDLADKDL